MAIWQDKIQTLMRKQGVSEEKLSRLTGIPEDRLRRNLTIPVSGEQRPGYRFFAKVSGALGVMPAYLLDEVKEEAVVRSGVRPETACQRQKTAWIAPEIMAGA